MYAPRTNGDATGSRAGASTIAPDPVPTYTRRDVPTDADSLRLVLYPDPALRRRAQDVPEITREVRDVVRRMVEIMYEEQGIGLAAPQVGLAWRIFVLDVPPNGEDRTLDADPPTATDGPVVFINPVIESLDEAPEPLEEGCLSLPDVRGDVLRPPNVRVRALDVEGRTFTLRCAGLLARCVQHEHDHLEGVLIIDRMTQMSRLRNRSAIRDLERDSGLR